ncbi:hypothetical protein FHX82_002701 [Amycolatopsis bartoniae]|uniref:ATP-binding protein n=1 Tax=Amycolatopsis bartoniae TaxID=941986 RepID=A0A8H9J1I9_9PSEU|nr:hypothetical protein [Amycolatopsis bartoniae]MBB2935647.1 hypothetical protein [Amycolatopsis bartoniae]TVT02092.1 hypothetical protein FNH07_28140 [Amycolatopsis bartoniae]GHF60848.1 hypothetical protein GCM10017566_37760 [Amycolatopsis bartoniae]
MATTFSSPPRQVAIVLAGPQDLAVLRRHTQALLTGAPEKDLVDALLVVNEVATIAWLADRRAFRVRLVRMSDGTLRAEAESPAALAEDLGKSGKLLSALAGNWGVRRRTEGALVWADIVLPPPPERPRVTGESMPVHG